MTELSFTQRHEIIKADLILEHGYFGVFSDYFGTFTPHTEAYANFGIIVDAPVFQASFPASETPPSVKNTGRCRVCGGGLRAQEPQTTQVPNGPRDWREIATAVVSCATDPKHSAKIPHQMRTLSCELSALSAVNINAAARERGF